MTDTLATFAEQVTNVAREVGVEGRLGGQANVPGAAGTWKDLTGNVNLLAANLTNQVRAIADVATAVTKGDLTRSIQVETRGEVADLKDNINTMIDNLRATTDRNQEQDWLKTNLAKFTRMLQGQRDLLTVGKTLLVRAGAVGRRPARHHLPDGSGRGRRARRRQPAAHAPPLGQLREAPRSAGEHRRRGRSSLARPPPRATHFAARRAARLHADQSSLGEAPPKSVLVLPVLFEGETMAVIELAALLPFTNTHLAFLEQLPQSIGVVLNTIEATMRTENQLLQSQQLTAPSCRRAKRAATNPTKSSRRRPSSSPSRTWRSSERTRKWSMRAARWKKRPPSLR